MSGPMKTVFITGAGRGLGLELTRVFLKNGWRVVAACLSTERLPSDVSKNDNSQMVELDVTNDSSITAATTAIKNTPIDILINNAGVYDSTSVDDDTVVSSVAAVTKVFQVNSIGPKLVSEALLPNLHMGSEKLIVTISSGMGTYEMLDEYHAKHWPYSASKTAVNYIMTAFHKLHPEIKTSMINPGWMKTNIGGKNAPFEPSTQAEKIFSLISDHPEKLPNATLVNYEGNKKWKKSRNAE